MDTANPEPEGSLTFVGTATCLLRIGGFTVLTDPNFLHLGERAYLGYGLWSKRRTEPATGPDGLPPLDAVVLSHLHGDHFDRRARSELARDVPIVTTRQAQRRLHRWGFAAATAVRTWRTWSLDGAAGERLTVTAVPARHGPAVLHRALPPVMGSVLELDRGGRTVLRIYLSGDTLYGPYLRPITDRFPDLDLAVVHLGGTRVAGVLVTMDARQGADLVGLLRPASTVPVHFDDYDVFRSPLSHFQHEMHTRGLDGGLHVVLRGQTVPLTPAARRQTSGR